MYNGSAVERPIKRTFFLSMLFIYCAVLDKVNVLKELILYIIELLLCILCNWRPVNEERLVRHFVTYHSAKVIQIAQTASVRLFA